MTFSKTSMLLAASCIVLAACGGSEEPATPPVEAEPPILEKPVENPVVAPEASTTTDGAENPFANLPEPYASADFAQGKKVFKQCSTCHTLPEGGIHSLGPNLYGVMGQEIASVEGFNRYSKAFRDSDIIWTPETLDAYLEAPRTYIPGNAMSFVGLRRPEDRTAVIAYVMSQTGYADAAPVEAGSEAAPVEQD